jgi:hypothetical protein
VAAQAKDSEPPPPTSSAVRCPVSGKAALSQ